MEQGINASARGKVQVTVDQALALGITALREGRLDDARGFYAKILDHQPDNPGALHWMGVLALQAGRSEEAATLIGRSVEKFAADAGAQLDYGIALFNLGHLDHAQTAFEKALALEPMLPQAHCNIGTLHKARGKLAEAEAALVRAVEIDPRLPQAHSNLAGVLIDLGRPEEAIEPCHAAIDLDSNYAEAHANLGAALKELHRYDEAAAACRRAIENAPGLPHGFVNLAAVLADLGEWDDAAEASRQAIKIDGYNADAYYNLGNVLYARGDLRGAREALQRAIELRREFADAHLSLGRLHLKNGDLAGFWEVYGIRWYSRTYRSFRRDFPQPRWSGEALAGKSLLVWGEQGVGDEIFFAGLLPEIISQAARTIVECESRLVPLFARSFPNATVVARVDPPDPVTLVSTVDYQAPSGDLGRWLRPRFEDFSSVDGYLVPDPKAVAELKGRYGDGARPLVGISWASRPPKGMDLSSWGPILKLPGVRFISLQYGDHRAEIEAAADAFGADIVVDPAIDPLTDMDIFSAQVASMDTVVTIDNSTLAVSVAVGRPTLALIPHMAEWRYHEVDGRNVWHRTLTTFRQPMSGDWSAVIEDLAATLSAWLADHGEMASGPRPSHHLTHMSR